MAALLVRLKLKLLVGGLRRSVWRTVGVVLGGLYALSIVAIALLAQLGARVAPGPYAAFAAPLSVLAFSGLTLGWMVLPLLTGGVDETVDPGRFALLPVRARQLQPGLVLGAFLGIPGVASILAALGQLIVWSTGAASLLVALVSVPVGLVTAVLLARVTTSALARLLARRRFRELGAGVLMLGITGVGVLSSVVSRSLPRGGGGTGAAQRAEFLDALTRIADLVGWTPVGWAWSAAPTAARQGGIPLAVGKLALAAAFVLLLWRTWERLLDRALVSPLGRSQDGGPVRRARVLDLVAARSPSGAVTATMLRYWRRDPRYLTGGLLTLTVPLLMIVANGLVGRSAVADPDGSQTGLFLAPLALGFFAGTTLTQGLSYDGTSLWIHATSGIRGSTDRLGRVLALLVLTVPMLALMLTVVMALTGRGDLVVPAAAAGIAVLLGGLGGGSAVGAYIQVAVPPPGASPFHGQSGGGVQALVAMALTLAVMVLSAAPALVLAALAVGVPTLGYAALLVALVVGLGTLAAGIRIGGARLDRTWPEVLAAVTVDAV